MSTKLISMPISGKDPNKLLQEQATPNNSTGLCNQLFHFINTLYAVKMSGQDVDIFFDFFSRDYVSGEHIPCSEILDLAEMNKIYNWNIREITQFDGGEVQLFQIGYVFLTNHQSPEFFEEIARKLIFNKKYEEISKRIVENKGLKDEEVNLVHLRIDRVVEKHIANSKGEQKLREYLESYETKINTYCGTEKKLVVLLSDIVHEMVAKLKEKYDVVYVTREEVVEVSKELFNEEVKGHELFALVDMLFAKNLKVDNFIYAESDINTSSYSVMLKYLNKYNTMMSV